MGKGGQSWTLHEQETRKSTFDLCSFLQFHRERSQVRRAYIEARTLERAVKKGLRSGEPKRPQILCPDWQRERDGRSGWYHVAPCPWKCHRFIYLVHQRTSPYPFLKSVLWLELL